MNQFSNLINDRIEAMRRKLQDTSRRKPNRDGFQLQITSILNQYLGKEVMKLWKLDWPLYDDKQICHFLVTGANKPVYVAHEGKEEFFVRKEGSSQPLSRAESDAWNRGRF